MRVYSVPDDSPLSLPHFSGIFLTLDIVQCDALINEVCCVRLLEFTIISLSVPLTKSLLHLASRQRKTCCNFTVDVSFENQTAVWYNNCQNLDVTVDEISNQAVCTGGSFSLFPVVTRTGWSTFEEDFNISKSWSHRFRKNFMKGWGNFYPTWQHRLFMML